jgi:hypothetical protein
LDSSDAPIEMYSECEAYCLLQSHQRLCFSQGILHDRDDFDSNNAI